MKGTTVAEVNYLKTLKEDFLFLGGEVQRFLKEIVDSQVEGNAGMGKDLTPWEDRFEDLELDLEKECFKAIAVHHPHPCDLRIIGGIIKALADMERIVFNGFKIIRATARVAQGQDEYQKGRIAEMGEHVVHMLGSILDAFDRGDKELALRVIAEDNAVDNAYARSFCDLLDFADKRPNSHLSITQLMIITRSIERIAEYIVEISKRVLFMIDEGSN